jgi:hypothetical protein
LLAELFSALAVTMVAKDPDRLRSKLSPTTSGRFCRSARSSFKTLRRDSSLKEMKAFVEKYKLRVSCAVGGKNRRTLANIYADIGEELEVKYEFVRLGLGSWAIILGQ